MSKVFYFIFLFVFLVILQVLVLRNIDFLGFIDPYLYISFVFFFPLQKNRFPFLSILFLLGLCIDFFYDSGGIHAFSILFIGYFRLIFVRLFFKKTVIDYLLFDLKKQAFGKVFNYVALLTFVHHFLLFLLENYSFTNFLDVLTNTLYSSTFTLILFFTGTFIFTKND